MSNEGNYDDVAALVRKRTEAQAVLVMVIDGKRGSGTASCSKDRTMPREELERFLMDAFRARALAGEQRLLGVDRHDVQPASGEVKRVPNLGVHHPHDDADQRLLRVVVADEVEAVFKKYDVSGAIMLVSRTAASWRSVFASWCGVQPDPETILRVRIRSKTPEDKDNADATMHFIATIREMCSDYANFYGRLWRQVSDALHAQGATIEHTPLGAKETVGGRPDPLGGKVD